MKQNERKQKGENRIDEEIDSGWFYDLASPNQIYVTRLNLQDIKNQILLQYTSNFELKRLMDIGRAEHKTNIRFRTMDDFEGYLNARDINYDSDDGTFLQINYTSIQCCWTKCLR